MTEPDGDAQARPFLPRCLDPTVADHPLVLAATRLADDLLEPQAAAVEAGGVPRSHLDAMGRTGVLGVRVASRDGRPRGNRAVHRAVQEILAGACPVSWFVQAQHQTVVALLGVVRGPVAERVLPELADGRRISG